jgi:hypothetical protein
MILFSKFFKNRGKMEKQRDDILRIKRLYQKLELNVEKLSKIEELLEREEIKTDPEAMTKLFSNEFSLCIENSGLYEDIHIYLKLYEDEYAENNLEIRRIKKDTEKLLRVKIVDL